MTQQAIVKPDSEMVQPQIVAQHADFVAMYEEGLRLTGMSDNAWRRPRFFHLLQMFRLTRGLAGATCEAGVYRGLASYLLCRERRAEDGAFDGTGHFAIDSFEGLSVPGERDADPGCAGRFGDTSVELVRDVLGGFPRVKLIKGWIPRALDALPEQRYRFVHVDVDLHDPTRSCLEYFYPRLVCGGVLVVDDYGPWPTGEWPGCRIAVHEFCAELCVAFAALDTGNVVIVKRDSSR